MAPLPVAILKVSRKRLAALGWKSWTIFALVLVLIALLFVAEVKTEKFYKIIPISDSRGESWSPTTCSPRGTSGFPIDNNAPLEIRDKDGKKYSTRIHYEGGLPFMDQCIFQGMITDIPSGRGPYSIYLDGMDMNTYSEEELRDPDFVLLLPR